MIHSAEVNHADPKAAVAILDALVNLGFDNEAFKELHHARGNIESFRRYCLERVTSFRTDDNYDNNVRVHKRLRYVWDKYHEQEPLNWSQREFIQLAKEAFTAIPEGGKSGDEANEASGDRTDEKHVAHRNPTWSRDELILALDLYVRFRGNPPGKSSTEIIGLSELLNKMGSQEGVTAEFRNPNGVYMKIMNFRRFDPAYQAEGKVGLQRGGKDEAVVWEHFASDPEALHAAASAIRANVFDGISSEPQDFQDDLAEAAEGHLLTRQHQVRERSRSLIEAKKRAVLRAGGRLVCEACGFDFEERYGERGKGFIEVHHTKPLHTLMPGSKTRLEDLSLLCSNCHRMVHAKLPWLSVSEVASLLGK